MHQHERYERERNDGHADAERRRSKRERFPMFSATLPVVPPTLLAAIRNQSDERAKRALVRTRVNTREAR